MLAPHYLHVISEIADVIHVRVKMNRKSIRTLLTVLALACASAPALAVDGAAGKLVSLHMLAVPIIENGMLNGQLRVSVELVPQSTADADALSERLPELRSSFLAAVNEFARLHVSIYQPVNPVRLRAYLLSAARAKGYKIKDVLVLDVAAF
jgi:hypothetical protein